MASLTKKIVNGRPYYYLRETARVGGRVKVVRQVYLGRAEDLEQRLAGTAEPKSVHSRSFGAVAACLKLCRELEVAEAIDRALGGIEGETVLHTCFGYAHLVHDRPSGYPFLAELAECAATHLSLEAAQPNLDPEVLRDVAGKTILLGVLDLGADDVETPELVAARIERALTVLPPERLVVAPDCGMKYLPRERAFRKLQAMVAGARLVREDHG
jgi:hypothetical protein